MLWYNLLLQYARYFEKIGRQDILKNRIEKIENDNKQQKQTTSVQ
jgi:hypothetical protein